MKSSARNGMDTQKYGVIRSSNGPATPLKAHYPTRRSLLASARASGALLSVFVPTAESFEVGQRVAAEISFADGNRRFQLTGSVTYVRAPGRGMGQNPGVGLAFEGADKKQAAEMIAFCAGKPLTLGTASNRRLPMMMGCVVRVKGHRVSAQLQDLSLGGAFIASPRLSGMPVGTPVEVQIGGVLFGLGGKRLEAQVIWRGEKEGRSGFGARFTGDPAVVRPMLRRFLPAK